MARYSAQFRNSVLRKLLPPQSKSVSEVAAEFGVSTATIYTWKARMNDGTLQVDDGAQGARQRQLSEKFSLLLESRGLSDEELGPWLRDNGLHSEHLTVWAQKVREAMTKGEQQAREELRDIHPGEVLLQEFLTPMSLSAYKLSKDTGIPQTRLSEIIHGRRRVTADTALRLAKYFGTSARFWLGLQTDFDIELQEVEIHEGLRSIRTFAS